MAGGARSCVATARVAALAALAIALYDVGGKLAIARTHTRRYLVAFEDERKLPVANKTISMCHVQSHSYYYVYHTVERF